LKKNKLLFIILGFIFSPLVANATNKTDWVQLLNILDSIEVISVNEPLENNWVQGFKLTKEEILFIECEEYEYSYFKPEKCLSNYNRFRNNKNLSYNHWSPSISKNDWGRYSHSSHPKSFKGWNKNYEKNKPYLYLK
jgi:hypothetical protein